MFSTIDLMLSLQMKVGRGSGIHDCCSGWQLITGWWETVLWITCFVDLMLLLLSLPLLSY